MTTAPDFWQCKTTQLGLGMALVALARLALKQTSPDQALHELQGAAALVFLRDTIAKTGSGTDPQTGE